MFCISKCKVKEAGLVQFNISTVKTSKTVPSHFKLIIVMKPSTASGIVINGFDCLLFGVRLVVTAVSLMCSHQDSSNKCLFGSSCVHC